MKQQVIEKLKKQIKYIVSIEKLQDFWNSNIDHMEKITAYYFSFSNPQNYIQNKLHYDNLVTDIIQNDTSQIKETLEKLCEELQNSEYVDNYIKLLNKQLSLNSQFQNQYSALEKLNIFNENIDMQKLIDNEYLSEINQHVFNHFNQSISSIKQNLQTTSQSLSNVEFFDLLKNKNENLILIGANGSGKSTFSRQIKNNLKNQFSSFVAVIPAQKTFGVAKNNSIPLKAQAHTQFLQSHTHDKLFKNANEMGFANSEFGQMINYLIAEHQEVANRTHQQYNQENFERKNSILEDVINLWEDIITHIKLEYDGQGNIKAKPESGNTYDFMGLSDGEKNIFYCIASVLLVNKDGYVIVDEPENHLHMSILNKLWNKLESIRSDCQFVYLTHNPSFAIGRAQAKILWIKRYTPPSNWEYMEIPIDDNLPQELMIELVGSKKNILFCEGERNSYDYKLYSILFKNYTIIPVGGHQKAIDYCKAFNENSKIFNLEAIAIIDKDFYEDTEITAWKQNKVYTLDVMEVENILCDNDILKEVQLKVHAIEDDYNNAKEQIFSHIQSTKDKQSMGYTRFKIDKILNSLVGKSNTPVELKEQLGTSINALSPQSFYNEHTQLLDDICSEKDYDKALKYYNNKGMISFVGDKILKDYKNRVVSFIKENKELQKKIIDKYFIDIPND